MRYPEEMFDAVKSLAQSLDDEQLAEEMSNLFGISITPEKMKYYRKNHGIRAKKKDRKRYSDIFPEGAYEWIKSHGNGKKSSEVAAEYNEVFGKEVTPQQIAAYRKAHHLPSGYDARFKKGQECTNRLEKGQYYPGCEKSWLKKGNVPHNTAVVGTIVKRDDGYLKIKVADPNEWVLLHRKVWSDAYGPIPEGKRIIFLDGNRENCDLSNLALVDIAVNAVLTGRKLRFEDKELTKSGIAVAELLQAVKNKKGEKHDRNKCKRNRTGDDGCA